MYGYDPAMLSNASISNPNVNDQNAMYQFFLSKSSTN